MQNVDNCLHFAKICNFSTFCKGILQSVYILQNKTKLSINLFKSKLENKIYYHRFVMIGADNPGWRLELHNTHTTLETKFSINLFKSKLEK